MTLDTGLLGEARTAADRLRAAETEVDRLRMAHRDAVRALHSNGATLREIAVALRLSHQRVHQLVAPPPGHSLSSSGEPKARPGDPVISRESDEYWVARSSRAMTTVRSESATVEQAATACLLCGEEADTTSGVCAACREAARRLVVGERLDGERGLRAIFKHNRRPCRLCGRLPKAGERFAEGQGSAACGACLDG